MYRTAAYRIAFFIGLGLSLSASAFADEDIKRDPNGRTGISPYMEEIAKGEKAFVKNDVPGAIAQFEKAAKLDAKKGLAHYRLGEALLAQDKVELAEAAWNTAKTKTDSPDVKAKALFCLADLQERKNDWQAAMSAWTAYETFIQSQAELTAHPATAAERKKQVQRRIDDLQEAEDRKKKKESKP